MKKSDFGRGLVICLVKFAEHIHQHNFMSKINIFQKWIDETPQNRANMLSDNPSPSLNYGFPFMKELKIFVETADKIYKGNYEKKLSHEIELWMNGASDHLYDIQVPNGDEWDEIRKKVTKLRDKGLEMGHGFTGKMWKIKDVFDLFDLTKEIAVMIDKNLGLNADIGAW